MDQDPPGSASVGRAGAPERLYLLVFAGERARMVELHPRGSLTIGSGADCELVLEDPDVAQTHARISHEDGALVLEDLDAPDEPTLVDGEPVRGRRTLRPGDLLAIGHATIEVRSAPRPVRRRLVARGELEERAADELERALRYGRPSSLVLLRTGTDATTRTEAAEALASRLRSLDVLAIGETDELWVLLPETASERAPLACRRFLEVLAPLAPSTRAAFASAPEDGGELAALVAAARRALADSTSGRTTAPVRRLFAGGRALAIADPAMLRLYDLIERLAASDLPVLLEGETGTGKELAALALHDWSPRREGPFVRINCAALPDALVENELFGHEKGAFSGADAAKPGLFETASGGTVLLDEVGELPRNAQAKLLRVIEERRVLRLGAIAERAIDVRLLAATNRSLQSEVDAGRFRADLFYRLRGGAVRLPPLRDRRREIGVLTEAFLAESFGRLGRPTAALTPEAWARLEQHGWPGNIRELRNVVGLLAATCAAPVVGAAEIDEALGVVAREEAGSAPTAGPAGFRPLEAELREIEAARMRAALAKAEGNQTRAAALISMPLRTWYTKAKQHGLR